MEELYQKGLTKIIPEDNSLFRFLLDEINGVLREEIKGWEECMDLNLLHKAISVQDLNNIRLKILSAINQKSKASKAIYKSIKIYLREILGPDIAIQRNVGLSIQLPEDNSSLLPIHSDVYSSDCSPYELVIWIPLVKCYRTKSMFFLPFNQFETIKEYSEVPKKLNCNDTNELFNKLNNKLIYLDIEPPSIALFSHSTWHGNTINVENETRVSINLRVKNVFSPYRGKKLGDFFEIAETSGITNIGIEVESIINE